MREISEDEVEGDGEDGGIPTVTTATIVETPASQFQDGDSNLHDASPPLPGLDTAMTRVQDSISPPQRGVSPQSPASAGLKLQTDLGPYCTLSPATATSTTATINSAGAGPAMATRSSSNRRATSPPHHFQPPPPPPPPPPPSSTTGPHRTPSVKAALSSTTLAGSLSPGSALSSPALGPMVDITPLPSPLISTDSPGPWNRIAMASRPGSRGSGVGVTSGSEGGDEQQQQQRRQRRKTYQGLTTKTVDSHGKDGGIGGHGRNRSQSEYIPEGHKSSQPHHAIASMSGVPTITSTASFSSEAATTAAAGTTPTEPHMKRESYLAIERGLARINSVVVDGVPTPPPSHRSGVESSDSDSSLSNTQSFQDRRRKPRYVYYDAVTIKDGKRKRWRSLYQLGQGTFSKVMLATSQEHIPEGNYNKIDEEEAEGQTLKPSSLSATTAPPGIDPATLAAVKIIEHGPAGGASEERIESSLKRELDILKSIHHPSLVHLEAFSVESARALLVLRYCDGGDLFELAASEKGRKEVLGVEMVRRIFAELVGAVRYLHGEGIVHRDLKLENVLLTYPAATLATLASPSTHPTALITLTDLGLSKRIDLASPLLTTRCGSEDYAAPELLMGLPYDGRATDAWALGVVLFALMEGRLPFDSVVGRSKIAHRIARVEWGWGGDGEVDDEWRGGREVVEGLLKRRERRTGLGDVEGREWVRGGIVVEGGLKCVGE
ncbi:MAG: hypothetical protein M1813_003326 [Trichoglossum hirsutum]|nr:MAG: hypothetical protein M1813_003326 [Trichoglossum hirsutum]